MGTSSILLAYREADRQDFTTLIRSLPAYVKPKEHDRDRTVCYHESSHVVILKASGEKVRYVTVEHPPHVQAPRPRDRDVRIMVHMAGIVGSALYSGRYCYRATVDLMMIDRELKKQRRYDLVPLWQQTHTILIKNWDWVSNLAERLHREKIIYY